jgi:tetratricopeptide (TPR) repeat protein
MTIERPPRLEHDAELGAIVRAAKNVHVGPERLAANADRIRASIAAGSSFAAWKLLLSLLLIGGAVAVTWSLVVRGEEPRTPELVVVAALPDAGADAALVTPDAATLALDAAAPEVPAAPGGRRPRIRRVEPAVVPPDAGVPDAATATSDLPEQIRLYDEARRSAARGDLSPAIDPLDELLRRFPTTQLRPDAELTRAELLARANRHDEAVTALEALASARAHAGRRAELLRTLGDLHRKHGDCARAVDAYTRALAAHPRERDRRDAESGRDRCTRR